jgi:heat shock protein HtpX
MPFFLDDQTLDQHRRRNLSQSAILLGTMGGWILTATYLIWGWPGFVATLAVLAAIALIGRHVPAQAVMRLYRAEKVPPDRDNQLNALLTVLAHRAELEKRPELYVVPSLTINAFATGTRDHSAIALTEGLLRRLTMREIAGVIGHELSHIRNQDLQVLGLADILSRVLQLLSYVALALALINLLAAFEGHSFVSWWGVALLYLAPLTSSILQLQLSRSREFDADLDSATLTGDPIGLAAALRKLETHTGHFWEDLMFPVPARRIPQPSLLRSHPTTEDRIARLHQLDGRGDLEPIVIAEQPMISLAGLGPIQMRPRYRWPGLWF